MIAVFSLSLHVCVDKRLHSIAREDGLQGETQRAYEPNKRARIMGGQRSALRVDPTRRTGPSCCWHTRFLGMEIARKQFIMHLLSLLSSCLCCAECLFLSPTPSLTPPHCVDNKQVKAEKESKMCEEYLDVTMFDRKGTSADPNTFNGLQIQRLSALSRICMHRWTSKRLSNLSSLRQQRTRDSALFANSQWSPRL